MSERAQRADAKSVLATRTVIGTLAIVAGLLTALLTNATSGGHGGAYVVAALLVLAGVGLRIEAAILDSRARVDAPQDS